MSRQQLIEAGREIVAHNLVTGSGGNLSCRLSDNSFYISRSGAQLDQLQESDFVLCSTESAAQPPNQPRPSSETPLHRAIYQQHSISFIFHAHPPHSIALGLTGTHLPALTPDFYLYLGGQVPLLPYITPTTAKFGEITATVLQNQAAVLLQNHGVVVIGHDFQQTLRRLHLLEEHARIYLLALATSSPLRILSTADMAALDAATNGRYQFR